MTVDTPLMGNSKQELRSSGRFSRRRFLTGSALAVAAAGLYPTEIERHFIEVVDQTFHIRRLPDEFRGFRIAQLSDIHLEWYTEDYFLRWAVNRINALKPDMVLLTGDFISNNQHGPDTRAYAALPHCAEILSKLQCPLRYAIMGNHDVAVDSPAVQAALTGRGITPLVNRTVPVERGGRRFWLSGLDDAMFGTPDIAAAVPANPDGPVILMAHEPDFIDDIVQHPRGQFVDLVLSGHTHGGQIRVPFGGPLALPTLGHKYVEGRFLRNQTQLYVNRGLGTVGYPVRFNCPPEITHITLQPA
jgi:predicted MPP superfamily phosphohydrolase